MVANDPMPSASKNAVTNPIAIMPAGRLQCVMMASGIAVAKMRTQSASARVNRKTPDAVRRDPDVRRVYLGERQP